MNERLNKRPVAALIDCGSRKCHALAEMIKDAGGETVLLPLLMANKFSFDHVDCTVISGGPHLFTDEKEKHAIGEQFSFIDHIQKPLLGICLGHQAIGLRYGASVFLGERIKGSISIKIFESDSIFSGIESGSFFGEDHTEGISLPKNFKLLASSDQYMVEAMKHMDLPLYGVQFHPEISGNCGLKIISNFLYLAA